VNNIGPESGYEGARLFVPSPSACCGREGVQWDAQLAKAIGESLAFVQIRHVKVHAVRDQVWGHGYQRLLSPGGNKGVDDLEHSD
jgi:hypothetical protein